MAESYDGLPLVYSCSGCSSAAQMANDIAVSLDRERVAEMSCIAGVGGDVAPLVNTAKSGDESERGIVVIDGCPLECAKSCLEKHDVGVDRHYELSDVGVPKEYHKDYDDELLDEVFDEISREVRELAET